MKQRRFGWELAGFLWTAAVGTLLHWLYEWSGRATVAAAFSAVNESVWEHMKLLTVPVFFFTAAEVCFQSREHPNILAVRGAALLTGLLLIPTVYYTYTGALGRRFMWVDIALFYAADAAVFWLSSRWRRQRRWSAGWQQAAGLLCLWLLLFLFIWCTYRPIRLPLWQDPTTLSYGIP